MLRARAGSPSAPARACRSPKTSRPKPPSRWRSTSGTASPSPACVLRQARAAERGSRRASRAPDEPTRGAGAERQRRGARAVRRELVLFALRSLRAAPFNPGGPSPTLSTWRSQRIHPTSTEPGAVAELPETPTDARGSSPAPSVGAPSGAAERLALNEFERRLLGDLFAIVSEHADDSAVEIDRDRVQRRVRVRLRAPRRPAAQVRRGLHRAPRRRGAHLRGHAPGHRDAVRGAAARHRRGHLRLDRGGARALRRGDRGDRRRRHQADRDHLLSRATRRRPRTTAR